MFGVNDLDGDEVVVDVSASEKVKESVKVVEKEVSTADPVTTAGEVVTTAGIEVTSAATTSQIFKDELTLAQTLIEIKAAKPKAITTTATTVTAAGTRPKEKRIVMQEPSKTPSPKPIISFQKPSQAKDKDYELAARLQEEEREELTIKEKSRLFVELMDKRKKHFTRLRAKRSELVNGSDKAVEGSDKAVEGSEKAEEGSSKRVGSKLEQKDSKRQKLEEENESAEHKRCLEIILEDDDDVTIEATPLSSESPTIGGRLMKDMYLNEVFGYIPPIKTKHLIKKLGDSKGEPQV
uniref:Uncharacterized protein n=1 Tax=Tanacetum cinerariifolium TaxID=118510 RepID=A0A6L2LSX6_TANCI|nr:hypothetical protein [Tanacetum cinerariifolium]